VPIILFYVILLEMMYDDYKCFSKQFFFVFLGKNILFCVVKLKTLINNNGLFCFVVVVGWLVD